MPRPKEFDPEQALDKAVHLFWRQGYQATSVQDLVDAMGINRFSLYDTFGDKHQLFLAALDRYMQKWRNDKLYALEHSQEGLPAIRRFFQEWLESYDSEKGSQGCFLTNSAVEVAPHDQAAAAFVRANLARLENAFYQALVRARKKGEIPKSLNLRDYACFFTNSIMGFTVLLKVLPDRKALERIFRTLFASLQKA